MGVFGKLMRKLRAATSRPSTTFNTTNKEMIERVFGTSSISGKAVTEDSAMGISAAWGCMRIIAETIGSIPWAIYRNTGDGNAERADDHELASVLIRSPNAEMTSVEFRESKTLNLCQTGNAYSWTERAASGRVISLYPLKSRDVTVMRKVGQNTQLALADGEVFFRINDRGKPIDAPRERVWHVKGFGTDGLVGLSPLGAAREAMGLALATEEFGSRFFRQGAMPAGIISFPGWLKPEQKVEAEIALRKMVGGLGNAHTFALFQGGMKPEPWGNLPLKDLEFLLLRKFSVQEICRFYRVPPHMVADLDRATFSNIEHMSQEFVMFTLMPYLTRFEASVSKWLLPVADRGRYFLRFNFEGLLRADSAGRAQFYASALQNGWMNRNEVRAKENLNQVAGLDEYTVQVNLTPIEQLPKVASPAGASKFETKIAGHLGDLVDGMRKSQQENRELAAAILRDGRPH